MVEGCGGRQLTLTEVAERLCAEVICGLPLGAEKAPPFNDPDPSRTARFKVDVLMVFWDLISSDLIE